MLKKAKQTYDSSSSSNQNSPERSSQIVSPINTTNKRRNQSNLQNHNQNNNNNGLPKELNQVPLPNDLSILNTIQVSFFFVLFYSFENLCVFKEKREKRELIFFINF